MKISCPVCDSTKKLIPRKHALMILKVPRRWDLGEIAVDNCEYYECPDCGADPVFPAQAKRNEERIKAARASLNTRAATE